jgi:hypothetical protein
MVEMVETMRIFLRWMFVALLVTIPFGCASAGGGSDAVFRAELGMATEADARTVGERVFNQFQYTLSRVDEPPNLRMESEWRLREPLADERSLGIVQAESRLVLIGRQRLETELGSQFAMTLMVENRVRAGATGEWLDTRNSSDFRAYARSIAERLETEFRTIGVRRF